MNHNKKTKSQLIEELQALHRRLASLEGAETGRRTTEKTVEKAVAETGETLQTAEGKYRTLIEGMNEGVIVVDTETLIQYVNERFCKMFGYLPQELLGKAVYHLFLSEANQKILKEKLRQRSQGISDRYEIEMKKKSGENIWTQVSAAPITDSKGKVIGSFGIITDITDRKHAEDALKRSEERFRRLVENAADAFFVVNPEGRFVDVNQCAGDSLGYTREELLTMSVWDIDENWSPQDIAELWKRLISESPITIEGLHRRKDGTTFPVEVRVGLFESGGRPLALALARDITERIKAEENESRRWQLELENAYLREAVQAELAFGEIVGRSEALRRVLNQIEMVAPTDASVLIQGESGSGKELIARAIHNHSQRSDKTMVKVNCSAIPKELFESEFFGHVKGAFTGALKDRVGRFELADGGTLFLDEISEIPLELQSKLLRILQEGQFERVGEDKTRQVKVRIIAATNRDLKEEIQAGRFREGLYYRLSVFPIEVPPLRDRKEDIPLLAEHFIDIACIRLSRPKMKLTQSHIRQLQQYDWPGNVRELQNVIERAVIISRGGLLQLELAFPDAVLRKNLSSRLSKDKDKDLSSNTDFVPESELRRLERDNIIAALERANWKIFGAGGAAELLGLKPTTFTSRLKKMGIKKPSL